MHPSLALFIPSASSQFCVSHFPGFPCLAVFLEGSSASLLAHLAGASLGAGSDAELLLDAGPVTHLPSDVFYPLQSHDFQGKGQSVTLCHYPL